MEDKRMGLPHGYQLPLGEINYQITEEIGRGASCIVYGASYTDTFGFLHNVRIKECYPVTIVLNRDKQFRMDGESMQMALFAKERELFCEAYAKQVEIQKTLGLVNATATATQIYEWNNTFYIVMEMMEGCDYSENLDDSLMSVLIRVKAVAQVIAKYHEQGYLYLDMKPENIFIIPETKEHVVLFDFDALVTKEQLRQQNYAGQEKQYKQYVSLQQQDNTGREKQYKQYVSLQQQDNAELEKQHKQYVSLQQDNAELEKQYKQYVSLQQLNDAENENVQAYKAACQPVRIACSPGFAAPEQVQGRVQAISERTDIYAIGALLYYKLFGTTPDSRRCQMGAVYDWKKNQYADNRDQPVLYRKLTEFLQHTMVTASVRRWQSMQQVIEHLNELIMLSDVNRVFVYDNFQYHNQHFVGRQKEMQELKELLDNHQTVFLHGVGGIGKTELARRFAYEYREQYDTVIFLSFQETIIETVNSEELRIAHFLKEETEEELAFFQRKYKVLQEQLTNRDMIILDNFDVAEDEYLEKLLDLPCQFLITSREDYRDYNYVQMEVATMQEKQQLLTLFQTYNNIRYTANEIETIFQIMKMVEYHTMTIELIAKYLRDSEDTPSMLQEKLIHNKGIKKADNTSLKHRKDQSLKAVSMYQHLHILFDISGFTRQERMLLQCLSLLGSVRVQKELFMKWYLAADTEKHIAHLTQKGWLLYEETTGMLSLHQIVLDLIYNEWKLDDKEFAPFLLPMRDYVCQKAANDTERHIKRRLLKIVVSRIEGESETLATFYLAYCFHIKNEETLLDKVEHICAHLQNETETEITTNERVEQGMVKPEESLQSAPPQEQGNRNLPQVEQQTAKNTSKQMEKKSKQLTWICRREVCYLRIAKQWQIMQDTALLAEEEQAVWLAGTEKIVAFAKLAEDYEEQRWQLERYGEQRWQTEQYEEPQWQIERYEEQKCQLERYEKQQCQVEQYEEPQYHNQIDKDCAGYAIEKSRFASIAFYLRMGKLLDEIVSRLEVYFCEEEEMVLEKICTLAAYFYQKAETIMSCVKIVQNDEIKEFFIDSIKALLHFYEPDDYCAMYRSEHYGNDEKVQYYKKMLEQVKQHNNFSPKQWKDNITELELAKTGLPETELAETGLPEIELTKQAAHYEEIGEVNKAKECLLKLLEWDKTNGYHIAYTCQQLCHLLLRQEKQSEALKYCEEVIAYCEKNDTEQQNIRWLLVFYSIKYDIQEKEKHILQKMDALLQLYTGSLIDIERYVQIRLQQELQEGKMQEKTLRLVCSTVEEYLDYWQNDKAEKWLDTVLQCPQNYPQIQLELWLDKYLICDRKADYEQALKCCQKAEQLLSHMTENADETNISQQHWWYHNIMQKMGDAYYHLQKEDKAEEVRCKCNYYYLAEEQCKREKQKKELTLQEQAAIWEDAAHAYQMIDKYEQAKQCYEQLLKQLEPQKDFPLYFEIQQKCITVQMALAQEEQVYKMTADLCRQLLCYYTAIENKLEHGNACVKQMQDIAYMFAAIAYREAALLLYLLAFLVYVAKEIYDKVLQWILDEWENILPCGAAAMNLLLSDRTTTFFDIVINESVKALQQTDYTKQEVDVIVGMFEKILPFLKEIAPANKIADAYQTFAQNCVYYEIVFKR